MAKKKEDQAENVFFVPQDAHNMGHLINRRTRELSKDDIQTITDTYHAWRNPVGADLRVCLYNLQPSKKGRTHRFAPTVEKYTNIKGLCCAAPTQRVLENLAKVKI